MRSFYHISVMIARGISESVMIAGRISQSSCRSRLSPPLWCSAGGLLSLSPANPAFGLLSCPLSPRPALAERSSPVGKGETISLFRRGLRPRHPCIKPFAALTVPAVQVPSGVAQAGGRLPTLPFRHPQGGLLSLSPAYPAFGLLSCPLSPRPPSPPGKGETISLFRRGLRPRHPCIRPFATLTVSAMREPRARSLRCGAKPKEPLSYEQCRQPRRGGTGGDGTIRRKRRRRLRWSSPPGQGNQVPQGEQPPLPPAGDMDGRANRQPAPCAPRGHR